MPVARKNHRFFWENPFAKSIFLVFFSIFSHFFFKTVRCMEKCNRIKKIGNKILHKFISAVGLVSTIVSE